MIKCEVIKEFTLQRFDELKNIERRRIETKGKLYVGDTFECTKEMADYLMGANKDGQVVVKIIEVEPEIKKELVKPFEEAPKEDALSEEATRSYLNDEPIKTKKKKSSKK